MATDDPFYRGQADAVPLNFRSTETLERSKKLARIRHIKSRPVVADEIVQAYVKD